MLLASNEKSYNIQIPNTGNFHMLNAKTGLNQGLFMVPISDQSHYRWFVD